MRDPWESRKAELGATLRDGREGQLAVPEGRLGRPQSPTKGSTAEETATAQRLLGAPEPEGLTVAGSFGFSASRRSLGLFLLRVPRSVRLRFPRDDRRRPRRERRPSADRPAERRERIVDAAMRHFAEHGYRGARVEDIAADVGVAKGTVFLDFGIKEGLFLAAFERAVVELPAWLDAPDEVTAEGFWAVLDWWLERTEEFLNRDRVPNRVAMIGRYDAGMGCAARSTGSCGARTRTARSSSWSSACGAARSATTSTPRCSPSMLDWVAERFQDALGSDELDPGLIHRKPFVPERREMRIQEFLEVLRTGIAAR